MTDLILTESEIAAEVAAGASSSDVDSSQGAGTISHTDSALNVSSRASDSDSFRGTKNDTDSQHTESDNEREEGGLRCSRKWLLNFFITEWRQYYRHFELNEKLFLHYKGFCKIENMHLFPDLKCLYFEGNGLTEIGDSLETCTKLMSLMLHENLLRKVDGLHTLTNLKVLNLSDNLLFRIEGLQGCVQLENLYMTKCKLGAGEAGSIEALQGLLECPSL